jgi:localization factor PodJL
MRNAGLAMANAMPWSVRGIHPEIREQAVEAAHRSGLSVGEWLNQVLAGNLEDDVEDQPVAPATRRRRPQRAPSSRPDDLAERLERLGRPQTVSAAHRLREPEAETGRVYDLIEQAVQAIERLEQRVPAAMPTPAQPAPVQAPQTQPVSDVAAAIAQLERRIAAMNEAPHPLQMPVQVQGMRMQSGRPVAPMRPQRTPALDDPGLLDAIAEIDQRRRDLDQGQATGFSRPQPRSRTQQAEQVVAFDQMRQQLDALLQRIDEMRHEPRPEALRLQDRLDQIAGRMEEWKSRPSEDLALIRRDLASLSVAIETLSPQRLVGMVEQAVTHVAEHSILAHQNRLPERLLAPLKDVHQDIRQILEEVQQSRSSNRLNEQVGLVARRLDEIGQQTADSTRMDEILRETGSIKSLIGQAMRAQPLEGLAHHIEALGKQLQAFQRDPDRGDERAVLDQIQEIRDRIERLDPQAGFIALEQRLSAIAAIETRLGAIAGIEQRLDAIARDVSKLANEQQPLPQLDSIAMRLERIDRVLDKTGSEPLAGLDVLAEKLDRFGTSLEKASQPDELYAMLERLSSRMAEVEEARADHSSLDALQEEILRLGERLETMPARGGQMDGLDQAVSLLMKQFEQARSELKDAAAQAAEKAARDAIRSIARDESSDALAAEGLLLLKRDLGEFKNAQGDADRRTRQTLEQLHSTLETLVGRLSQMESAPRSQPAHSPELRAERVAPAMPPTPAQAPKMEERPAPVAPSSAPAKPQPTASQLAPRPQKAVAETLDDLSDLPLEPGQRPGGGRGPVATADANTAAAAADPRSAFIAAARRAAQVAAERSQEALSDDKAEPKGKKPARGAATASGDAALAVAPRSFMARARKPLLLGLAAILFSMVGVKLLLTRGSDADRLPAPNRPAIEAPAQPMTPPAEPRPEQRSEAPASAVPAPAATERTGAITPPEAPVPGAKRATRLADSSAVTQADPLTVGSISGDGAAKPIETGRDALASLGKDTKINGQDRLREAAIAGNPAAIFEMGSRLADGRGAPRDPKLAARWFEQAAASGHAPSQYRLASLYREGRGVTKDPAIAFQWFDRAAAQGHVLAMHNAGVLLAEGVHGAPDYAGAALWFRRAAEHGVKDSQFNVAILFTRGLGVNQDLGEAFRWFSLAAAQGDQDAIKKRDDVAARLSKDQLAKERERLKAFVPAKPNPASNDGGMWDKSPTAMFPPIGRTTAAVPNVR